MGGEVYSAVSPPEPATVSVGGGMHTGDIRAPEAPDIFSFLGVRESSGTQGRLKCDPEDPFITYTLGEILTSVPRTFVENLMRDKRKSPSKAKGGKPSGGKTPDSGRKGRSNSDRGRQGGAGGGFGKGDDGGSSNRGRSPGSNSSAPSSRYNDKGVKGKDRPPTQAVVNPKGPNRNPVLDRYGVRHRDRTGSDAFIGMMAGPGETPIKPGKTGAALGAVFKILREEEAVEAAPETVEGLPILVVGAAQGREEAVGVMAMVGAPFLLAGSTTRTSRRRTQTPDRHSGGVVSLLCPRSMSILGVRMMMMLS
uniref:Uncharacterized protein n=1 Tax=Chromera velia CCMP2878 TaxID=1169474 RepID=A0A0G4FUW5_9ALVE|eukprot:Cvel_18745.t1-p1 / transcript=Cvel_18745.t1 / gene=Cvel_18745 / organism=Chromera_velia_CCMP2878 / gene_product=hypothetical protein / transcript_product=hypothetical protein / location=Cvel_scaffold1572:3995-6538(-) / protein_length=308 / sequence_SO=supercontig / SO=protein_coding / is_pseudo=false